MASPPPFPNRPLPVGQPAQGPQGPAAEVPPVRVQPARAVPAATAAGQPSAAAPILVRPVGASPGNGPVGAAPIPVAVPARPNASSVLVAQPLAGRPAVAPVAAGAASVTPAAGPVPGQPVWGQPVPGQIVAATPVPVKVAPNAATADVAQMEPEEEEAIQTRRIFRMAPPWLVSMVVHMILLIVLALWTLPQLFDRTIELEVRYAEELGVQLEDMNLQMAQLEPVDVLDPALSFDSLAVDDPFAAPPDIEPMLDGFLPTDNLQAPSIGMALSGREKGMKEALLGAYGGNATTEAAVRLGLEWLKKNQQKDGRWSLKGPYSNGGASDNHTAATAMALLAFQGAGHTHREGDFKQEVAKGWQAMLKMQNDDGDFYNGSIHNHRLYSQAQATIAICELYGMTKDQEFRKPAQLAIDYAVKNQASEGGWRYTPGSDSDTSVTGWFVMALQSAMMAGLEVPSPTLDNVNKFLDSVARESGTRYSYRPGAGATPPMTAEALLCRQYLGWKHDDERLTSGVEHMLANPISYNDQNVYYWYYATQVLHHMEGKPWDQWNRVMRQAVPENQVKTGAEKGSWNPTNDRWGAHGGRLYTTCLSIYMLEVYYRHLPIYKYRVN